jgi:hypothetical protein
MRHARVCRSNPLAVARLTGRVRTRRRSRPWRHGRPRVVEAIQERLSIALRVAQDTQAERQETRRAFWTSAR